MGKKDSLRVPKTKCCVKSTRCDRCPIRLLKEGAMPDGYAVRKRRLVRTEPFLVIKKKQSGKKITKKELEKAVRQTRSNRKALKRLKAA